MPAPYAGGCSCGAVRFMVESEPLTVYACHCTDCQRSSGSAFTLSMLLSRAGMTVTQGEPAPYVVHLAKGAPASGFMCGGCGTRLWRVGRTQQHYLVLRAGTLDQTAWIKPVAHVWTRSAQPWLALPDGPGKFELQPGGWDELIGLSQGRAGGTP